MQVSELGGGTGAEWVSTSAAGGLRLPPELMPWVPEKADFGAMGERRMGLKISVIGLGKLGLPLATMLAQKHDVIGVDKDEGLVRSINQGEIETFEPSLAHNLAAVRDSLSATMDAEYAAWETDLSFIVVPTPSLPGGRFSLGFVQVALEPIVRTLKSREDHFPHTIALVSTVSPGSCRYLYKKLLAAVRHERFTLVYNPEFIALGSTVEGMREPDSVLYGVKDPSVYSGLSVPACEVAYNGVVDSPPAFIMTWEEAEWAKLLLNCTLSAKASLANQYAQTLFQAGLDPKNVLDFIGKDHRIGRAFFGAGPQPGGTCLPRDLRAAKADSDIPILEEAHRMYEEEPERLLNAVESVHEKLNWRVGVLGMSYKKGVPIYEETLGLRLLDELVRREIPFMAYDPFDCPGVCQDKLEHVLEWANVVVIALPEKEYKQVCFYDNVTVVVDPWGLIPPKKRGSFHYIGAGGAVWTK